MPTADQYNAPVVAGVDSAEASLHGVRWAADAAARHHTWLHLVHAAGVPGLDADSAGSVPEDFQEELRNQKWEALRTAREAALNTSKVDVRLRFEPDPPIPFLIHISRTAQMIVLGSSGSTALTDLVVGSTTLDLIPYAHCPVVSVPGDYTIQADNQRPIVVGGDGSPASERAVDFAFDEADRRHVSLIAVQTYEDTEADMLSTAGRHLTGETSRERAVLPLGKRITARQQRHPDVAVRSVTVRGRPRQELLAWSRTAQLVVIGSRGRGGLRGRLLGSTSRTLIQHAVCPVMIVPGEASD